MVGDFADTLPVDIVSAPTPTPAPSGEPSTKDPTPSAVELRDQYQRNSKPEVQVKPEEIPVLTTAATAEPAAAEVPATSAAEPPKDKVNRNLESEFDEVKDDAEKKMEKEVFTESDGEDWGGGIKIKTYKNVSMFKHEEVTARFFFAALFQLSLEVWSHSCSYHSRRTQTRTLSPETGRNGGRGRGRGNRTTKETEENTGSKRKRIEAKKEEEIGWYCHESEWDSDRQCWWWEVQDAPSNKSETGPKKSKGDNKDKEGKTDKQDTKRQPKITTSTTEEANTSEKAPKAKQQKRAASSSKGHKAKMVKVVENEPTPKNRQKQIDMILEFVARNNNITEDCPESRLGLRSHMGPLKTCRLNVYFKKGTCGVTFLKQNKDFAHYNFLCYETSYNHHMAVSMKAAQMLATCPDNFCTPT